MRFFVCLLVACGSGDPADPGQGGGPEGLPPEARDSLDPERMRDMVEVLAADDMAGRIGGSPGGVAAAAAVKDWMVEAGLEPAGLEGGYEYVYAAEPVSGFFMLDAEGQVVPHDVASGTSLMGMIPGSDPAVAHETMVVMAHWDHLGVTDEGAVYNGAFDNAGGVALAMEVARLFATHGAPPRSILIMFTDGEEAGLDTPKAWLEEPTLDPDDVVFALSADPLGRPLLPDYAPIVLAGAERSPELLDRLRTLGALSDAPVVFANRDMIPVFASDQDPFFEAENPRPGIWMTNPGFSFYHTPEDTAQTIDYRLLLDSAEFLAELLWGLGHDTETYAYEGPGVLDGQAGRDVRALLEGVRDSTVVSAAERNDAADFIATMDEGIAADDLTTIEGWQGFSYAVLYFLMFELGEAHPGEIPPPFPQ